LNVIWYARNNARFNCKSTNVSIHPPKAPIIKEVIWQPPPLDWVKCNTDGACVGNASSCGSIFRNNNADFVCFC
jgi:hypothetical protein